jgi:protein SMG6
METFQMCAIQMLKEFRALLQISPITINSHRLLQLLSLNMYAITCTELKGESRNMLTALFFLLIVSD